MKPFRILCLLLAAAGYARADKPAADTWARQLKDKDAAVRIRAIEALAKVGPREKGVVPALVGGLKDDPSEDVRAAALAAFRKWNDKPAPTVAPAAYPLRSDPLVVKVASGLYKQSEVPRSRAAILERMVKDGGVIIDPTRLKKEHRRELEAALTTAFGTPTRPKVAGEGEDEEKEARRALQLGEKSLTAGARLYRRHCQHCHGLTGDGRGEAAPWVNPYPRDYRQGKFKFISTDNDIPVRKARRKDLMRTLRTGIEGTAMPSFAGLRRGDLESLVGYVIHLAVRGEVEFATVKTIMDSRGDTSGLEGESIKKHVSFATGLLLRQWAAADKSGDPPPYPYGDKEGKQREASIRRGYELFTETRGAASCINCHVDFGRNNPYRFDDWGTLVTPTDLTRGVFKGGRRPVDLYCRILQGIPPAGMPGAFVKPDHCWDLVNFVLALPDPRKLPADVRKKIYRAKK